MAVDTANTEDSLVNVQSSGRRFLIAVPPLSRVTGVALAFDGQASIAARPCCAAVPEDETSRTAPAYLERDSGGLAFVECWIGASESSPSGSEHGPYRPKRLEVSYEPLPQAERARRESLLLSCAITDSSIMVFSNPTDVRAWYRAPDTNLSSLFGGDPVPYDFEFAELAEVPLRCQVVIMAHPGGWGNVPVEGSNDIFPILEGLREDLSARGVNSILVPYYRTGSGFIGNLQALGELFGVHHKEAGRLSREIDRFLTRHSRQRIVMIGLSNGASFADDVMLRLSDAAQGRVCALEFGPLFLNPAHADEFVLRLDNDDQDPVAMGDYWVLTRIWGWGLFRLAYAWLAGQEITLDQANDCPEHKYPWPAVRQEVVAFIEGWLRR